MRSYPIRENVCKTPIRRCAVGCVWIYMLRQICTISPLADVHLTSLRKNKNVLPDQRFHGLGGIQRKILRTNERFPSILWVKKGLSSRNRFSQYMATPIVARAFACACGRACSLFHHSGSLPSAIKLAVSLRGWVLETYMSAVLLSENPSDIKVFSPLSSTPLPCGTQSPQGW